MLQFESYNLGYLMANRLVSVNGTQVYAYGQGNHRLYSNASGAETIYLYRLGGRKLATYQATVSNTAVTLTFQSANVRVAGRRNQLGHGIVGRGKLSHHLPATNRCPSFCE